MARRPNGTSLEVAITRLSKLAAAGTSPGRMTREAHQTVGAWQAIEPSQSRQWAATLRDDGAEGLAAAFEQAEDVDSTDGGGAAKQAKAVVDALRATVAALDRELSGLRRLTSKRPRNSSRP